MFCEIHSYQYVSFQEQAGFDGDADTGLTVSLDVTANISQTPVNHKQPHIKRTNMSLNR